VVVRKGDTKGSIAFQGADGQVWNMLKFMPPVPEIIVPRDETKNKIACAKQSKIKFYIWPVDFFFTKNNILEFTPRIREINYDQEISKTYDDFRRRSCSDGARSSLC